MFKSAVLGDVLCGCVCVCVQDLRTKKRKTKTKNEVEVPHTSTNGVLRSRWLCRQLNAI